MQRFTWILAATLATAAPAYAQDVTVIHAGTLIASPGDGVNSEQSIVIEDGLITEIRDGYADIDGARVVDLSDMHVLPGMMDSHVHLLGEFTPRRRLDAVDFDLADQALDGARHARTTLEAGFTTVRDVGGSLAIFALRDAIRDGDVAGPRIYASGPAISPTGGHGDVHGYSEAVNEALRDEFTCDGPADCRRAVRAVIRAGADVVKITATGGVLSNTAAGVGQQFFDDELEAIVEAARFMGREVTAHAHGKTGIESALRAGVASIEHGTYSDDATFRLFRSNGAYLVPTALAGATVLEWTETSWLPEPSRVKAAEVGPIMFDMLRRAHEADVNIAFGTDSGVSRHGENARELGLLVEAGFSPAEALRAATVVAAEHLDVDDHTGTIAPGMAADIIAVDGDPLADIDEMLDVDFVMRAGVVYVDAE